MLGLKLFIHAVRMVINNWQAALRIVALPFLMAAVANIVLSLVIGVDLMQTLSSSANSGQADGPMLLAALGQLLISITLWVWIAVYWHRYILLAELPDGFVYRPDWAAFWDYFVKSALLSLMVVVPLLIVFVAIAIVSPGAVLSVTILSLICALVVVVLLNRILIVLPALAVGRKMSLREAWQSGSGQMTAFVVVCILQLLVGGGLDVVLNLISTTAPLFGTLLSLALSAGLALLGLSVLTTLYGHFVEKRPLA